MVLIPQFVPGQTFDYSLQFRTSTIGHTIGPVRDPEGPSRVDQSVGVILELQVMSAGGSSGNPGPVHFRATYKDAAATTAANSFDPEANALAEHFRKLKGRSIEFTLEPDGRIEDVEGLGEILPNPSSAAVVRQWLSSLTLGAAAPRQGITVGTKWASEQPATRAPLAGLAWRTESTYLRNEPCPATGRQRLSSAASRDAAKPPPEECAVILTRSELIEPRSPKDRTPEEYRRNGLRTYGDWTGRGEGLTAISLRSGMVASVTQTATQRMDFTIMTATAQARMNYSGVVRSQSQITLESESSPH